MRIDLKSMLPRVAERRRCGRNKRFDRSVAGVHRKKRKSKVKLAKRRRKDRRKAKARAEELLKSKG